MKNINGKRVAILATDGYEQSELLVPMKALKDAGATVHVISLKPGMIKGWDDSDWGDTVNVDFTVDEANAAEYDALMLPGGVMNPDKLRIDKGALTFITGFFERGLPVGAICHAPWTLINADLVDGRTLTSWPSLEQDLKNAGAKWVDEEVVCDQGLVTSRKPDDLPAFCEKLIEEIAEGFHEGQTA